MAAARVTKRDLETGLVLFKAALESIYFPTHYTITSRLDTANVARKGYAGAWAFIEVTRIEPFEASKASPDYQRDALHVASQMRYDFPYAACGIGMGSVSGGYLAADDFRKAFPRVTFTLSGAEVPLLAQALHDCVTRMLRLQYSEEETRAFMAERYDGARKPAVVKPTITLYCDMSLESWMAANAADLDFELVFGSLCTLHGVKQLLETAALVKLVEGGTARLSPYDMQFEEMQDGLVSKWTCGSALPVAQFERWFGERAEVYDSYGLVTINLIDDSLHDSGFAAAFPAVSALNDQVQRRLKGFKDVDVFMTAHTGAITGTPTFNWAFLGPGLPAAVGVSALSLRHSLSAVYAFVESLFGSLPAAATSVDVGRFDISLPLQDAQKRGLIAMTSSQYSAEEAAAFTSEFQGYRERR